jgi:hypothetical protein
MRLFLAGKVDEAIELLDEEKLRSSIAQAEKRIAEPCRVGCSKLDFLIFSSVLKRL